MTGRGFKDVPSHPSPQPDRRSSHSPLLLPIPEGSSDLFPFVVARRDERLGPSFPLDPDLDASSSSSGLRLLMRLDAFGGDLQVTSGRHRRTRLNRSWSSEMSCLLARDRTAAVTGAFGFTGGIRVMDG